MRLHTLPTSLLSFLLLLSSAPSATALRQPQTVSLQTWPYSSPTPSPYLTVTYQPTSDTPAKGSSVSLSTTQPPAPSDPQSGEASTSIRLGFYRSDLSPSSPSSPAQGWVGISVPSSALADTRDKTFTLHLDGEGAAWHLGLESIAVAAPPPTTAGKKSSGGGEGRDVQGGGPGKVEVRLAERQAGPKPVLNKPIVLNKEGKLGDEGQQQSFFQKYWWVIALFFLLQAVIGGGGGDAK